MINPLDIATDGLLGSPISFATRGLLIHVTFNPYNVVYLEINGNYNFSILKGLLENILIESILEDIKYAGETFTMKIDGVIVEFISNFVQEDIKIQGNIEVYSIEGLL